MSEDLRQPSNKTLIEEVLLEIRKLEKDLSHIKNDLKEIHRYMAIQYMNEEKLQQGENLEPVGYEQVWWSFF